MQNLSSLIGKFIPMGALAFALLTSHADAQPTITADPNPVEIKPPAAQGSTTLTWNAGQEHPYAEVWVKVDDAEPIRLFEMDGQTNGRGTLKTPVQFRKLHHYILTDNGEDLATVDVKTIKVIENTPTAPPPAGSTPPPPAASTAPYGAIAAKYLKLGGATGVLGPPVAPEVDAFGGGRAQAFRSGIISWHPEIGEAFAVYGIIGERWIQLGREQFGYPITDETSTGPV